MPTAHTVLAPVETAVLGFTLNREWAPMPPICATRIFVASHGRLTAVHKQACACDVRRIVGGEE
jgi:hypothetical protein